MAQIVVRSDADQKVLLSERIEPAHLDDERLAVQFLERLAWAIEDPGAPERVANGKLRVHPLGPERRIPLGRRRSI